MESYKALWDVGRVALVCMMCVQIFGVYFSVLFPKEERVITYECDFKMKDHVVTMPCEIRSVTYD